MSIFTLSEAQTEIENKLNKTFNKVKFGEIVTKAIPGFAKRIPHHITEEELNLIEAEVLNDK